MLRIFFALSFTLLFISCDKDDESTPEIEAENFYGLTVGNTYSYSYYQRIGDTEDFEQLSFTTNVAITDEVVIDDKTYFEFTTTATGEDFFPGVEPGVSVKTVREEDGVLITEEDEVLFSKVADSEPYLISENDWGNVYLENLNQTEQKTVPAGDFNCNVNALYAILEGGEQSPGTDVLLFSDGIGEIYRTISAVSNPTHNWEVRLTSYSLAE
ncbi:hypothetical protein SCB49_09395 [unidentified eubacterium SCB49]|nr:hypothetical protein SCB49_09395 [unidentified eubacterium SCB49]